MSIDYLVASLAASQGGNGLYGDGLGLKILSTKGLR